MNEQINKQVNNLLKKNYKETLTALLRHEIDNGAQLVPEYTVESAIDDFMNNYECTTMFDLKKYLC